jgi:hypothetical protein
MSIGLLLTLGHELVLSGAPGPRDGADRAGESGAQLIAPGCFAKRRGRCGAICPAAESVRPSSRRYLFRFLDSCFGPAPRGDGGRSPHRPPAGQARCGAQQATADVFKRDRHQRASAERRPDRERTMRKAAGRTPRLVGFLTSRGIWQGRPINPPEPLSPFSCPPTPPSSSRECAGERRDGRSA